MNHFKLMLYACTYLFFMHSSSATTIIPFPNLGEMAKASDAVVLVDVVDDYFTSVDNVRCFRSELEVLETIKGTLSPGDIFELQNMKWQDDHLERIVFGDLEMEIGHQYLLFLDQSEAGYWQAKMLSYAALELMEREQELLLVPFGLGAEVQVTVGLDGLEREPLRVFKAEALQKQLRAYVHGSGDWDLDKVSTSYAISSFQTAAAARMARPDHCSFVIGNLPPPRWQNFAGSPLPVYTETGGDNTCSEAVSKVQSGINAINSQYSGVNLEYAGTHNFVPNCSDGNAASGNYTSFFDTRSVSIQFDDPCNQISDLSNCSGILAIGGLYVFSSTHEFNGETWRNAAYGYVVVNNGTGACQCDGSQDYDAMIIHEMTHTLNVGHISFGAGTANMNPSCCNLIQPLDVECLDYMYLEEGALPIALAMFDGKKANDVVKLEWQTASELNNDYFTIERSIDGFSFTAIGKVSGQGTTSESNTYQWIDRSPRQGINYYRLRQTDFDDSYEILPKILSIEYEVAGPVKLFPNPVHQEHVQIIYPSVSDGDLEILLFDASGKLCYQKTETVWAARNEISLALTGLAPGVYTVQLLQGSAADLHRLVKW